MPGAYKMLYQKVKGGKTDTTFTSLQQQKIFTDEYMMYANFNPSDSVSAFGVATYSVNADTVTEKVFFSGSDSSKTESPRNYKLLIEKTGIGYKQIIPEIESQGEKFILTEDYEAVGTNSKSALDGAWKLEKTMYIKGKDTSSQPLTQFKIYHAGHFIWGHSYTDSSSKIHTGMGFGTFALNGTDKLKEMATVSTYYEVRGKSFDIAVAMNGSDAFTQTITNKDSSVQVETYRRIKK